MLWLHNTACKAPSHCSVILSTIREFESPNSHKVLYLLGGFFRFVLFWVVVFCLFLFFGVFFCVCFVGFFYDALLYEMSAPSTETCCVIDKFRDVTWIACSIIHGLFCNLDQHHLVPIQTFIQDAMLCKPIRYEQYLFWVFWWKDGSFITKTNEYFICKEK